MYCRIAQQPIQRQRAVYWFSVFGQNEFHLQLKSTQMDFFALISFFSLIFKILYVLFVLFYLILLYLWVFPVFYLATNKKLQRNWKRKI